MRVTRKGEVVSGGAEGGGAGAEAVKGAGPLPMTEGVSPSKGKKFAERLFSRLLSEIRGSLETLQARVDGAAGELVAQPNQIKLDAYKEAVSHLMAFIIGNSVVIKKARSLKRGKDGKPKEFSRVETIDEKLARLAQDMHKAQKPMLDLVSRLDEIRGLLVDLYDWNEGR